jgi:hypothetical protein
VFVRCKRPNPPSREGPKVIANGAWCLVAFWCFGGLGHFGKCALGHSHITENCLELIESRLQIVSDLLGNNVRIRETGGIFKAVVLEPENVEVDFVPLEKIIVAEGPESL